MNALEPPGLSSLVSAGKRLEQAANDLVSAFSGGPGDAIQAVKTQIEANAQFKAGLGVVRASDAMLRELIEMHAERN